MGPNRQGGMLGAGQMQKENLRCLLSRGWGRERGETGGIVPGKPGERKHPSRRARPSSSGPFRLSCFLCMIPLRRAFIITDKTMFDLDYAEKVRLMSHES